MLSFCDRTVDIPREDVAPVWTRSFPISKEATTLGQHLRKKRFNAGMRQTEAAQRLGVSRLPSKRLRQKLVNFLESAPLEFAL